VIGETKYVDYVDKEEHKFSKPHTKNLKIALNLFSVPTNSDGGGYTATAGEVVTNLTTQNALLSSTIDELKTQLTTLSTGSSTELETLKTQNATLESTIDDLKSQITTLSATSAELGAFSSKFNFKDISSHLSATDTTINIDLATGSEFEIDLTMLTGSVVTLAWSNTPVDKVDIFLKLTGAGNKTINWGFANIKWIAPDGSLRPTHTEFGVYFNTGNTTPDFVYLWSYDGGVTVYGKIMR